MFKRRNPDPFTEWAERARAIELAASLRKVPRYDLTTAALIRAALRYVPATDHLWTRHPPSQEVRSATNSDIVVALQRAGHGDAADVGRTGDLRGVRPNPAYDVAEIKRAARAAGHPVYSVKNGTGSLRGLVSVYFDEPLPGPEAMSRASEWMRARFPDVPFSGLKPQQFCDYWLRYSAAERKAKDARPGWGVRGNPVRRKRNPATQDDLRTLRDALVSVGVDARLTKTGITASLAHGGKRTARITFGPYTGVSFNVEFSDGEKAQLHTGGQRNFTFQDAARAMFDSLLSRRDNPGGSFTRTAAWKTATSAGQGVRVEKPTARTTIVHGNGGKAVRIVRDASDGYYCQLAQNARADGTGDVIPPTPGTR